MKKFLIAGSSLAAVAAAGSAGAVDVTLGGTIDMGTKFGLNKDNGFAFSGAYGTMTLSIAAAGTTDGGLKYGGSFSLGTAGELKFNYYDTNGDAAGGKNMFKQTVKNFTDLQGVAYNVSGGEKITENKIVAVKINSAWKSVSANTREAFHGGAGEINSSNICKVAGQLRSVWRTLDLVRTTSDGFILLESFASPNNVGQYLPAGRLTAATPGERRHAFAYLTAATLAGNANVPRGTRDGIVIAHEASRAMSGNDGNDRFTVGLGNTGDVNDDVSATLYDTKVTNAAVFMGPFAEVRLQSSTTKMVVGAVCVTGKKSSDTKFYMDNDSKVVTAAGASIFIEGGFGKVTLQTGDYAGKVSAIGDAGDAADIDADGLVVIAEGVGLLGANPYLAMDLAGKASELEVLTGGSMSFGGASIDLDLKLGTTAADDTAIGIAGWDMGATYALGDIDAGFALDSSGDFGAKASMSLAGLGLSAEIYNKALADHKKGGLQYKISGSTSMNGASMSVSYDQDGHIGMSAGYDLGNLNLYAGYDGADKGGKIGAKLSF